MTDTEQAPAADTEAEPVPAHLAGPGLPGTALEAVRAAGWTIAGHDDGEACATSPDGCMHLAWTPERADGPVWELACKAERPWLITADANTPAEFITALITAITTAGPLNPGRDRA